LQSHKGHTAQTKHALAIGGERPVFLQLWVGKLVLDAFLGLGEAGGQEEEDAGSGLVVGIVGGS
jgi:hypothetical protein